MPFYGRDWRSPGELWFKTIDGHWIKTKDCRQRLLESLNDDFLHRIIRRSLNADESCQQLFNENYIHQPHFFIKREATKEAGPLKSLTEILSALNFKSALSDTRRFHYVCKILKILIQEKMHLLSGRTQIFVMELLQEAVKQVLKTGNNIRMMRELLDDLRESLRRYRYQHIGSYRMWQNHWEQLEEMEKLINELSVKPVALSKCRLRVSCSKLRRTVEHMQKASGEFRRDQQTSSIERQSLEKERKEIINGIEVADLQTEERNS